VSSADALVRQQAEAASRGGKAVIATDVDGRILYWNDAAERLYGWKSEEVLGQHVMDVTPTQVSQAEAAQVMRMLRSAESWKGQFEVRDKAGRAFIVDVTDLPVLDRYGKLIGIIGESSRVDSA
jgi:two-component system, cell cycle sensor histidine kinase and response regulator CckA